ncbi:MAG: glutamate--tRNA ligase [Candidatus Altiarchaeota archaeon]
MAKGAKSKDIGVADPVLPGNPKEPVLRFAPNPNGPPTIGSSRGIVLNHFLAKKYGGTFILRFDDTDPKVKKPLKEAYDWYVEDCTWLGCPPDRIVVASENMESYYEYAEKLIDMGKAYVCQCTQEEFKKFKDRGEQSCPHRDQKPQETLDLWKQMLSGKFEEKEVVLRIKTDFHHPDPALRDWVAFRILKADHVRVGKKYVVWPMLDMESAIEDHLQKVTHILRGKELRDSELRQKFIYDYLGWDYPKTIVFGRMKVEEYGKLSTSGIAKAIEAGEYAGWDDPRLPMIRAFRRRGIQAEAIRNLMLAQGFGENDISFSLENLYAENRKIADPLANRYYFIPDPMKLVIEKAEETEVQMPLHPSFKDRGFRKYTVRVDDKGQMDLWVSTEDIHKMKLGEEQRLMNLTNFHIEAVSVHGVKACALPKNFKVPKLQWLSDYVEAEVRGPEGVVQGYAEPMCTDLNEGDLIQFERYGFVKLDEKKDNLLIFYFAHK